MDRIDEITAALASAHAAEDPDVRAIYIAVARSRHVALVAEAQRLGDMIIARERELARLAREGSH